MMMYLQFAGRAHLQMTKEYMTTSQPKPDDIPQLAGRLGSRGTLDTRSEDLVPSFQHHRSPDWRLSSWSHLPRLSEPSRSQKGF